MLFTETGLRSGKNRLNLFTNWTKEGEFANATSMTSSNHNYCSDDDDGDNDDEDEHCCYEDNSGVSNFRAPFIYYTSQDQLPKQPFTNESVSRRVTS